MSSDNLWLPYTQMRTALPPKTVVSTNASEITLEGGQTLIDGISSWWTACHGYNHPHLLKALTTQAQQLSHVMLGGLVHEPAQILSQKLSLLLPKPLNHVFFSESGSVAVEVALKMALQYWMNQNQPQRKTFIHFKDAYHGDTFMAMSLCDPDEGMHHLFKGLLPQQQMLEIPTTQEDFKAFEKTLIQHQKTIAGLIIEPLIQGAGGMKCHSPACLNQITAIAKRYEIPVIFDEIFTGFGRTSTLFALNQIEHCPDIVCLGKALTGGVTPLAATIASSAIYESFLSDDESKALMHGPTFMGHALGCQVALASCELFEQEPRLEQAKSVESFFLETFPTFTTYPGVKEVRVKGAMGVIEMQKSFKTSQLNALKAYYLERGVWIRPFGNIIYLAPALNIPLSSLSTLTDAIKDSLAKQIHI